MDGCKNYDLGVGNIAIWEVVKIAVYGCNSSPTKRKQSNHCWAPDWKESKIIVCVRKNKKKG